MSWPTEFDFAKIGRAPAHFDPEELAALNAKTLHAMPYDAVARLARWACRRSASGTRSSPISTGSPMPKTLARLVTGPVTPVIEDAGAGRQGRRRCCRPNPGTKTPGAAWTKAVAAETGAKGGGCFIPCGWR